MDRHRGLRAHAESYVATLLQTVDLYEAVVAEMEDMTALLAAAGYPERASHARQVARDHRVKLLLHQVSAATAQDILARMLNDEEDRARRTHQG